MTAYSVLSPGAAAGAESSMISSNIPVMFQQALYLFIIKKKGGKKKKQQAQPRCSRNTSRPSAPISVSSCFPSCCSSRCFLSVTSSLSTWWWWWWWLGCREEGSWGAPPSHDALWIKSTRTRRGERRRRGRRNRTGCPGRER